MDLSTFTFIFVGFCFVCFKCAIRITARKGEIKPRESAVTDLILRVYCTAEEALADGTLTMQERGVGAGCTRSFC